MRAAEACSVHVLGVRHHSPSFAAAVEQALAAIDPAIVLIEGPPEATPLLGFAADPDVRPPVALTVTARGGGAARFFPYAAFSPEWRAMLWALRAERSVRFIDLPWAQRFPLESAGENVAVDPGALQGVDLSEDVPVSGAWATDPAAAFTAFAELAQAVAAVRAGAQRPKLEQRREAAMRRAIRAARRAATGPVVAICGAWHAPALDLAAAPSVAADAHMLRGLARTPVDASWTPWSMSRLAEASGYAAGVEAPGYADHLWRFRNAAPRRVGAAWAARLAQAARAEALEVGGGRAAGSTADALAAAQLAEALAALRDRDTPNVADWRDAARAAVARGDEDCVAALERQVVIGQSDDDDGCGRPPSRAPRPALIRDVERLARSLRLPRTAAPRRLRLDLRRESGRARSVLLWRLALLEVDYAEEETAATPTRGGFREDWRAAWRPETDAALLATAAEGETLAIAAARRGVAAVERATRPDALVALATSAMAADLPAVADRALDRLATSALDPDDIDAALNAIVALAAARQRATVDPGRAARLARLEPDLITRAARALPLAARRLSEAAERELWPKLIAADEATADRDAQTIEIWRTALARLAADPDAAPRLSGWCAGRLSRVGGATPDIAQMGEALSERDAGRLEGLLVAVGCERLFDALDSWLLDLPETAFLASLPGLRAAFAGISGMERAAWSRRGGTERSAHAPEIHEAWAAETIDLLEPLLTEILGPPHWTVESARRVRAAAGDARVAAERIRRWRLAIGPMSGERPREAAENPPLDAEDRRLDGALQRVYPGSHGSGRRRAVTPSALSTLTRALPPDAARDALRAGLDRLSIAEAVMEPDVPADVAAEAARRVESDLGAAAELAAQMQEAARRAGPEARRKARALVARSVAAAATTLGPKIRTAVRRAGVGAHARLTSTSGGGAIVDWRRTLDRALAHGAVAADPAGRPIIAPDRFLMKPAARLRREVILCLDQSGSMRAAAATGALVAATLAGLQDLRVTLLAFDHRVIDLTDRLDDPTALLLTTPLGGVAAKCFRALLEALSFPI